MLGDSPRGGRRVPMSVFRGMRIIYARGGKTLRSQWYDIVINACARNGLGLMTIVTNKNAERWEKKSKSLHQNIDCSFSEYFTIRVTFMLYV